jgi:hypothetical protein
MILNDPWYLIRATMQLTGVSRRAARRGLGGVERSARDRARRLVPQDVLGLVRYLREHAAASSWPGGRVPGDATRRSGHPPDAGYEDGMVPLNRC